MEKTGTSKVTKRGGEGGAEERGREGEEWNSAKEKKGHTVGGRYEDR